LADILDPYTKNADIKLGYSSDERQLILSAGSTTTSVDCNDFIKDGMLSSVELCDTTLVLKFNTDAGSDPISIHLSDVIDNYLDKRTGGYVSGDVGILSGNFIQTDADVDIYGGKNAFIQADTNNL
jgi:hypothetical protein